jgi:glutaredoxin
MRTKILTKGAVLAVAVMAGLTSHAVAQGLYKYTTPDGKTVYTDTPPRDGTRASEVKIDKLANSAMPAAHQAEIDRMRSDFRKNRAAESALPKGVLFFTAVWCAVCKNAKQHLLEKRVAFSEVDIDTPSGRATYAQLDGAKGVPVLLSNGRWIAGFSPRSYDSFLFPPEPAKKK